MKSKISIIFFLSCMISFGQTEYDQVKIDFVRSSNRNISTFELTESPNKSYDGNKQLLGFCESGIYQFEVISSPDYNGKNILIHNPPIEMSPLFGMCKDFNGDGKLDLFFEFDRRPKIALNIKEEGFNNVYDIKIKDVVGYWTDPSDQNLYLVTYKHFYILSGLDGKIKSKKIALHPYDSFNPEGLTDIDDNGVNELLFHNYTGFHLISLDEKKVTAESIKPLGWESESDIRYVLNFSGSNKDDILEINDTSIFIRYQLEGLNYEEKIVMVPNHGSMEIIACLPADIDNDGDLDLLFYGDATIFIENKGEGKFKYTYWEGHDDKTASAADLNGDGKLDYILNSYLGLFIYYQGENLLFTEQHYELCRYANFYFQFDADQDGDLDLLLSDNNCKEPLQWMENDKGELKKPEIFFYEFE